MSTNLKKVLEDKSEGEKTVLNLKSDAPCADLAVLAGGGGGRLGRRWWWGWWELEIFVRLGPGAAWPGVLAFRREGDCWAGLLPHLESDG